MDHPGTKQKAIAFLGPSCDSHIGERLESFARWIRHCNIVGRRSKGETRQFCVPIVVDFPFQILEDLGSVAVGPYTGAAHPVNQCSHVPVKI
jgi:hypothetical protein